MKQPPTKKFKVTFEIEAIPYNKETYGLCGPCFMEGFPEDIYAKQDIGDVLSMARYENLMAFMRDNSPHKEYKQALQKRINKVIDSINSTIKFEAID